eukprot:331908-Amorphochlora_amoeboformis.AAC.1
MPFISDTVRVRVRESSVAKREREYTYNTLNIICTVILDTSSEPERSFPLRSSHTCVVDV